MDEQKGHSAMAVAEPEFSRPIGLDGIGEKPLTRSIEASPGEREALAVRFGLESLDGLRAKVTVAPVRHGKIIAVEGTLSANAVQKCVVTLNPVPVKIDESFALKLMPTGEGEAEIEIDPEGDDPEPLADDSVDIGEIVAQHFSLALDPYPRVEGVEFEGIDETIQEPPVAGPFAALEQLKRR